MTCFKRDVPPPLNATTPSNQKAHEVTRDVTAWALWASGLATTSAKTWLGPILRRECFRPGLASARSARAGPVRVGIVQTVDRDSLRRDRSPNGVAWRFPDWTAVGFRCGHLAHIRTLQSLGDASTRRSTLAGVSSHGSH